MSFDVDTDLKDLKKLINDYRNQCEPNSRNNLSMFFDWLVQNTIEYKSIKQDITYHKERLAAFRTELNNFRESF